ncbi:MAG: hypothetical protein HY695_35895 [Deltaproteobacteria bacterium]|nr:hypothetical protein [Deltaproteobacteria bacterium]
MNQFGVTGSRPWVTILCRFADSTYLTPHGVYWFETLMGSSYPGMDHYWREVSYGKIDLSGSVVVGWYDLPQPRSYYFQYQDGTERLDVSLAVQDCTAAADHDVFFPDFSGINLMFKETLDCCAHGGSWTLNRDGQLKNYSVTWIPPWGYEYQSVLAHEMGHGFGLPHSSGPYGATYDSRWDVMSNSYSCRYTHWLYNCVAPHTIAFHKDKLGELGWIPSSRKLVASPGQSQTLVLERLGEMPSSNSLMLQIPVRGSSTEFYTVEGRRFVGYDNELPAEGVVIHHVDTTRIRPAQVVDPDYNGNPNDEGATWLPGETFVDQGNGITVAVNSWTATGFEISFSVSASPPSTLALLDHFTCYRTAVAWPRNDEDPFPRFIARTGVYLDDPQVESKLTNVISPVGFCNPAWIDVGEKKDIIDPETHLEAYRIKDTATRPSQPRFARTLQTVLNQFGNLGVVTTGIDRLLVPTLKSRTEAPASVPEAREVDHYKCYSVTVPRLLDQESNPISQPLQVNLEDQFGSLRVTIGKPLRLCNPVSKQAGDGELKPIKNPENHLMCYQITRAKTKPPQPRFQRRRLFLNNEFGPEVLDTTAVETLCVPSLVKSLP